MLAEARIYNLMNKMFAYYAMFQKSKNLASFRNEVNEVKFYP